MKVVGIFFVIAWFVFATFEVSFDRDVFRAYTASERSNYDPEDGLPRMLPRSVTEFRVRDETVVSRVGDNVSEYENCRVFDKENWSCTYSDESATFGAKQGEYFIEDNLEKFPHLATYSEEETLSRFSYIILKCRWDATGGIDVIMCLFRPFTI